MKTCSVYHWYQQKEAREEMQFIAVEVFIQMFTVFIFNYKVLFICVKDRAL